jgi:amino acid transporter
LPCPAFGGWIFVAVVIDSFFDFGIAINNSLTRMPYYLSRDSNILPGFLKKTHAKYGTPSNAIITVAVLSFIIAVASGLIFGPFVGALVIEGAASIAFMLQHALATFSLPFYTHREKVLRISSHIIIPAVALGFIAFAIFSTVYPVPAFPFNLPAYMVVGWVLIGALVIAMVGTHKMAAGKSST